VIDLSKELVRPFSLDETNGKASSAETTKPPRMSRQSGKYLLDINGRTMECTSLRELLAEGLRALEKYKPGMLEQLSVIKPRTKRIVARDPARLFDQQELVANYAERLGVDGWWYGTNNSADETNAWLRRAAELAGLSWGKDVSTTL
jgi:hypothetical protein